SMQMDELEEIALESLLPASKQTSFQADPTILGALGSINSLLGRSSLLTYLKERLFAEGYLPFMALYGLPGIRKTTLAAALAADHQANDHFPDAILIAMPGQHPKVLSQLACWGKLLGIVPCLVNNLNAH